MLDLELGRHSELGALLDLERLVLQSVLAAGLGQVDDDGLAALRVHGKRVDDANPRVVGVREILPTAAEAERLLVSLQRLVALVCIGPMVSQSISRNDVVKASLCHTGVVVREFVTVTNELPRRDTAVVLAGILLVDAVGLVVDGFLQRREISRERSGDDRGVRGNGLVSAWIRRTIAPIWVRQNTRLRAARVVRDRARDLSEAPASRLLLGLVV